MHTGDNTLQTIPDIPWSHRLSRILRLTTSITLINRPSSILRPPLYPSGEIWKHIFSGCVYSDLAGSGSKVLWGKSNRRLVRFERMGLTGAILYEILGICGPMGCIQPMFTMEEVFGGDNGGGGMGITRLLELTNAKVVYFPAYACTSFAMGQVMHAFLTNSPDARPHPAHDGFYVIPDGNGDDNEEDEVDNGGDSSIDSLGPDTPPRVDSPAIDPESKQCYGICQIW